MEREHSPRWTRAIALALLAGSFALAIAAVSCNSNTGVASAQSDAEKIALGKRLTYVAACNDCHTPGTFFGAMDTTRLLSGSELGWEGPWGVTFPRNLTPDLETGLGAWSEEDIVNAIRLGQRPDKSPILPPMPWPMYAHMTDEEAYAIAAYLKSIPPVKHRAPERVPPGASAAMPRFSLPPTPPGWDVAHMPAGEARAAAH